MLRPRSQIRSNRPLTFTLDYNSHNYNQLNIRFPTKRSKSSPNQSHQIVHQNYTLQKPSTRRSNSSETAIQINYKDEGYFYKHLHQQRVWKIGNLMNTLPSRKDQPDKAVIGVLQRFRDYMEKKTRKRVPIAVQDILDHSTIKF